MTVVVQVHLIGGQTLWFRLPEDAASRLIKKFLGKISRPVIEFIDEPDSAIHARHNEGGFVWTHVVGVETESVNKSFAQK